MISKSTIDAVNDAVRIEEVVGDYVRLKRSGSNYQGLCPFHNEKTPSFSVSPLKGIYKCFGCGETGNAIGFVMDVEKITYPEAIKQIAKKYQIPVEETLTSDDEQYSALQLEKESIFIINEAAQQFYAQQLQENTNSNIGMAYVKERQINMESITLFGIGFAQEGWSNFSDFALQSKFKAEHLESSGLALKGEKGYYDRFRARVIFPFYSVSGKIVGFGGRILSNDKKEAKYINSPETPVYTKGSNLYGLFQAKKYIKKSNICYLVEGYLDVISLHQVGINQVVATSGTALTVEQCKLLKRFTEKVVMVFDSDLAGENAAAKGVVTLIENDFDVKILQLPPGEDPDSFARKNSKTTVLDFFETQSVDYFEYLSISIQKNAERDPAVKTEGLKQIALLLSKISDILKRTAYISQVSKWLTFPEQILMAEVNKLTKQKIINTSAFEVFEETETLSKLFDKSDYKTAHTQERELIRVLLNYHDATIEGYATVLDKISNVLAEMHWESDLYKMMYDEILSVGRTMSKSQMEKHFTFHENSAMNKTAIALLEPYALSENWEKMHDIFTTKPEEKYELEVNHLIDRILLKNILKLLKENQQQMQNKDLSHEEVELLLETNKILSDQKMLIAARYGIAILGD